MQFAIGLLHQKLSSNCPFYENCLSNCHTFTVTQFIVLSFKHQTNKPTAISVNTTNGSRNTKLQNCKQQSLQVQISVLLQLFILSN